MNAPIPTSTMTATTTSTTTTSTPTTSTPTTSTPTSTTSDRDARLSSLNDYLTDGIKAVNGWCIPHLWHVIWPLYEIIGDGAIAEIGVFEGKFFIGLAKTFRSAPGHVAIDVFDQQRFNLDKAGAGNRTTFDANLEAYGIDNVTSLQRDSLTLSDQDVGNLVNAFGGFKLFSVDGCHTALHTINDVKFAMRVTRPEGIITVDDYLNPNWPGVGEGIAKMFLMGSYPFVPVAYTCNKLFLCTYSHHAEYLAAIERFVRAAVPAPRIKRVPRFGFDTLTIAPESGSSPAVVPSRVRQSKASGANAPVSA